jgi:hypothetical protein
MTDDDIIVNNFQRKIRMRLEPLFTKSFPQAEGKTLLLQFKALPTPRTQDPKPNIKGS